MLTEFSFLGEKSSLDNPPKYMSLKQHECKQQNDHFVNYSFQMRGRFYVIS